LKDDNLVRFRAAVAGALAHLESRREEVNLLNVFPVADGDTGDNMALTLRAVLEELDRLQAGDRSIDEIGREEIVNSVTRAALLGARGNSGVILSQLIRGAAEELVSRPGQLIDATLIGAALANAADRAYASVREPAEGTILTVAREMAHRIAADVAHTEGELRMQPDTPAADQDRAIAAALERAVRAGEDSVRRGPELLPALREAGVVDAGGYGLTVAFAGVVAALRGDEPPPLEHHEPARVTHPHHASANYRYCTNFAVTGEGLEAARFTGQLEQLGDSVLVVGDSETLKVHLHTDDPEAATAIFAGAGEVSRLDVADMKEQVEERDEQLAREPQPVATAEGAGRCAAVAVVSGPGIRDLYHELGVHTIDGGATMNPSTTELLAGVHAVPTEEVVLFANSTNSILAAQQAAHLSDKQVFVVPTSCQQAGLSAAVALQPERPIEENAVAVQRALDGVRTGSVAAAAREDPQGRFAVGDAVGFVDEELIAWGEPQATLAAVVAELANGNGSAPELISVYEGEGAPSDRVDVDALPADAVELEVRRGGQRAWWWLLSAE